MQAFPENRRRVRAAHVFYRLLNEVLLLKNQGSLLQELNRLLSCTARMLTLKQRHRFSNPQANHCYLFVYESLKGFHRSGNNRINFNSPRTLAADEPKYVGYLNRELDQPREQPPPLAQVAPLAVAPRRGRR